MLSDTSYLILALILIGPLLYTPHEEKAETNNASTKEAS
jgi:hypothetical protein